MKKLRNETGTAILLITHDMGVVADMADRVAVMYAGRVIEHAPVEAIFAQQEHPYTKLLLSTIPRLEGAPKPICQLLKVSCRTLVHGPMDAALHHAVLLPKIIAARRYRNCRHALMLAPLPVGVRNMWSTAMNDTLLSVDNLKVYYPIRGGLLGRPVNHVKAVDGVSLNIARGESVALAGESGCGKSTRHCNLGHDESHIRHNQF